MAELLVIDDDKDLTEVIVERLKRLGHNPDFSHTLSEALTMGGKKDYDLIFLDVRLPDGDGLAFLPKFKSLPSCPDVIIITGSGSPDGAELAIRSGAWCYLEKASIVREMLLPLTRALEYRAEKKKHVALPVALKRPQLIGSSRQLSLCLDTIAQAAKSDVSVLISGETGSGKEVIARTIHDNSPRSSQNFVVVDCAALPENLVESILFGHVKGAFTDARSESKGLVQQADGGTLFLDEIGELSLNKQKAFLRVLQERTYRPVGSTTEVKSNFRLIAASNKNLDALVAAGQFRNDLLYRLKSLHILSPPLRERKEDIKELTIYFITILCERYGLETKGFSPEFIAGLREYPWPGNVRELFQVLDHVFTVAIHSPTIYLKDLPDRIRVHLARTGLTEKNGSSAPLKMDSVDNHPFTPIPWRDAKENLERVYTKGLLDHFGGNIQAASRFSGLSRTRIYQLMGKYDLNQK